MVAGGVQIVTRLCIVCSLSLAAGSGTCHRTLLLLVSLCSGHLFYCMCSSTLFWRCCVCYLNLCVCESIEVKFTKIKNRVIFIFVEKCFDLFMSLSKTTWWYLKLSILIFLIKAKTKRTFSLAVTIYLWYRNPDCELEVLKPHRLQSPGTRKNIDFYPDLHLALLKILWIFS